MIDEQKKPPVLPSRSEIDADLKREINEIRNTVAVVDLRLHDEEDFKEEKRLRFLKQAWLFKEIQDLNVVSNSHLTTPREKYEALTKTIARQVAALELMDLTEIEPVQGESIFTELKKPSVGPGMVMLNDEGIRWIEFNGAEKEIPEWMNEIAADKVLKSSEKLEKIRREFVTRKLGFEKDEDSQSNSSAGDEFSEKVDDPNT